MLVRAKRSAPDTFPLMHGMTDVIVVCDESRQSVSAGVPTVAPSRRGVVGFPERGLRYRPDDAPHWPCLSHSLIVLLVRLFPLQIPARLAYFTGNRVVYYFETRQPDGTVTSHRVLPRREWSDGKMLAMYRRFAS